MIPITFKTDEEQWYKLNNSYNTERTLKKD